MLNEADPPDTGPSLLFWIVLNKNLFWLYFGSIYTLENYEQYFFSHYIHFKMNGLLVIIDNLSIDNGPNTKWVRFSGTLCILLS